MTTISQLIQEKFHTQDFNVEHATKYGFVVDTLGADRCRQIMLNNIDSVEQLAKAYTKDKHLNNYPNTRHNSDYWDSIGISMIASRYGYSLCQATCIAKHVAEQIAKEFLHDDVM